MAKVQCGYQEKSPTFRIFPTITDYWNYIVEAH